jgi:hypothetical protein
MRTQDRSTASWRIASIKVILAIVTITVTIPLTACQSSACNGDNLTYTQCKDSAKSHEGTCKSKPNVNRNMEYNTCMKKAAEMTLSCYDQCNETVRILYSFSLM